MLHSHKINTGRRSRIAFLNSGYFFAFCMDTLFVPGDQAISRLRWFVSHPERRICPTFYDAIKFYYKPSQKKILVQDQGGGENITGGILQYSENFKFTASEDIGPKDFFEMACTLLYEHHKNSSITATGFSKMGCYTML